MTISRQRASARKAARRFGSAGWPSRRFIVKGHELIPSSVLRQLAELHLPLNKQEYTERLNELLRLGD